MVYLKELRFQIHLSSLQLLRYMSEPYLALQAIIGRATLAQPELSKALPYTPATLPHPVAHFPSLTTPVYYLISPMPESLIALVKISSRP